MKKPMIYTGKSAPGAYTFQVRYHSGSCCRRRALVADALSYLDLKRMGTKPVAADAPATWGGSRRYPGALATLLGSTLTIVGVPIDDLRGAADGVPELEAVMPTL